MMDALGIDKSAHRRPFDGRLHGAPCRHAASGALHFGDCGRLRLGSVADPAAREAMRKQAAETAQMFTEKGMADAAAIYADNPTRLAQKNKDPRGYAEFARMLSEHSAQGHALTMAMLQARRPTLWDMEADLKRFSVPLLVIVGDEDDSLPRRQRLSQAHRADGGSPGHPALRSHRHQRGAGRGQCGAGGFICGRRRRALARAPGAGVDRASAANYFAS